MRDRIAGEISRTLRGRIHGVSKNGVARVVVGRA
jgi:hypothetical protein